MIDRICEITGIDPKEFYEGALMIGAIVLSLIIALAIISGWVAFVIYVLLPFSIDASVWFLRVLLAIGGAFMIGFVYCIGLWAILDN